MTPQSSIQIEVVTNGFLVTNPRPQATYGPTDRVVYTRLQDLQAQLPALLKSPDVIPIPMAVMSQGAVAPVPALPLLEYAVLVKTGGPALGLLDRPCIIVDRGDSTRVRYWRERQRGHTTNKAAANRYTVKSAYDWLCYMERKDKDECYALELVED